MRGTNFRLFLDGLRSIPGELKISEVVVDEVVNRFREDLEAAIQKSIIAEKDMYRLTNIHGVPRTNALDPILEAKKYREQLLTRIKEHGGEILHYPDIPHKRIVERDLQRKKPFKMDGSGYRDCLIWESIKNMMFLGTERVLFITNNHKDFGKSPFVAPELQSEIINPNRLTIYNELKDLNDNHVIPKLKMLGELKNKLQIHSVEEFDVLDWLKNNLIDLITVNELGTVATGFPDGVGRIWPKEIVAINEIRIDDVREMESGEKLVRVFANVDVEFSIDIDWDDYVNHQEVREWVGDSEEHFSSMGTYNVEKLKICVDLILDNNSINVISEDMVSAEGSYSKITF
jgi:hypothetical protein